MMRSNTFSTFMRKAGKALSAAVFAAGLTTGAALAQDAATAPAEPIRALSVDRQQVLRDSDMGKDLATQAERMSEGFQKDAEAAAKDFQGKQDAIIAKKGMLSEEKFNEEVGKFQQEVQAKDREMQINLRRLQVGVMQAQGEIAKELGPIFTDIMKARGANMLLDKNAVIAGSVTQDITAVVIERLNKTGKRVKLKLPDVPADAQ